MNFFEGLGIFIVAAVIFLILSAMIGAMFTTDQPEWFYLAGWLIGSFIYGLTVVGLIYISRCGGSL